MIPSFKENHISQIPALLVLVKMGYTYLSPEEAEAKRGHKLSNVFLEDILEQQLQRINVIRFRGKEYPFSNANIHHAIRALKDFPLKDGLVRTNEKVYDLLTLGKSFEENIQGDRKSFTMQYIDWENPENNVFHVTDEFSVEKTGSTTTRRPDIVLFVNGIPLAVMECKSPALETKGGEKPVDQAISQHIRNQKMDEVPGLFIYAQILMALGNNDARYATAGSGKEFWSFWREKELKDEDLYQLKNKTLDKEQKEQLFNGHFAYARDDFDSPDNDTLEVTEQDRLLTAICEPKRLLELTYRFMVYDAGVKKIARYQQFFAVRKTIERIKKPERGRRKGGVIWHTQGSGKSLTMVMLAKAIALEPSIQNPRIVLVTDRVDLDDQIYRTFRNCDREVVQAKTGKHLMKLIHQSEKEIITTVLDKFEAAVKQKDLSNDSADIFVLVDESHRGQYGTSNIRMQQVLPNACYIGFTGTPLMKKEKSTARRFGGFIDTYTIDQAVADKAVVPLLYEGRHVVQEVNKEPIDNYFNMICEPLSETQQADIKKKFSRADQLNEADQKIYRTCWDISYHYKNNWQGTGFKGQLTAPSKLAAMKYKEYMDDIGIVNPEVLISGPDTREGHESIYDDPAKSDRVQQFWKNMMERYGSEKVYNKQLINAFKHSEYPEILIVVDKLLTGFDSPRNTVLYICRSLREHNLLQAVARVNRVFEGKDFGYIIDYYGILGELDQALTTYSELSEFDEKDVEDTLTNVREEVDKIAERHSHVWDMFKGIENKKDVEQFEIRLRERDIREDFYERLSVFARTLKMALSSFEFVSKTAEEKIQKYTDDAKFFLKLRVSVKSRYSDTVDYRQYEPQVQKLIDTHVTATDVIQVTDQVNIFEQDKFEEEVEKVTGNSARADMIASRTARTITERMEEDPAFYKKFSKLLQETIDAYQEKRFSDAEYLKKVKDIMENVRNRTDDSVPEKLTTLNEPKAYYGITFDVIKDMLPETDGKEISADIGIEIDRIIRENLVVDWHRKQDVQNKMRQAIEDYLFELKSENLDLGFEKMDEIIEKSIEIAKHRY